ncbi:MAG: hypothetical protein WAW31_13805 [Smithella sp.]
MNKARVSTQILLYFLMMLLLISGCTNTSDDFIVASSAPNTYSISGTVSGITGVTINLTGASTTSVKTDTTGAFNITGLASGKYTITPVKAGYIFTPSSVAVTVSGGTVTVPDFAATSNSAVRYSISGTVSGAVKYPVLVTLSDDGSATTWTDANGNYTFTNLVNGSYTVTPSLAGYTFALVSAAANISGSNVTVPNFVSTADSITYSQTDIEGIWNINILRKGTARKEWERFRISVDSTGVASCIYHDSSTKVISLIDTLPANLASDATSFYVRAGATDFSTGSVVVKIGSEKISCTYSQSTHQFTSCTRGFYGTTAAAHLQNDTVIEVPKTAILSADLPIGATSFFVNATNPDFPTGVVVVQIGSEKISGTYSQSSHQVTSCTRGFNGTTAAAHLQNDTVIEVLEATLSAVLPIGATSFFINAGTSTNFHEGVVVVQIEGEKISGTYDQATHHFTSCTRGFNGSTAVAHLQNVAVTEIQNNPTGETACPSSFNLTLTMASSVVTPSGTTAADLGITHMTMTSSKNFIAGTSTSTDSSYQLAVMQKEMRGILSADLTVDATSFSVNAGANFPTGTVVVLIGAEKISGTYNPATHQFTACLRGFDGTTAGSHLQDAEVALVYSLFDVQNKNFVYHQLQVGKINQWERAAGQTDAGGAIRLTSLTSPSGSASDMPKALGVTFVLNTATGRVDMSGTTYESFQGFLSDDKKTIVGTFTDNISDPAAVDIGQNDYHLIVFQMDDQTYPAGALPDGTYVAHLLGIGSQFGWGYFTSTVASGAMTFGPPTTDKISITLPTSTSGSISASGVVTISGISSYHGQMSYDGKFIVGTRTLSDGVYSLQVDTK